ncbi:MAG: TraV family lipoprotein [Candidatus Desulfaltia sp.]|nr:TraV family lipoprotein [Candidatus Desulfaltia sp.]
MKFKNRMSKCRFFFLVMLAALLFLTTGCGKVFNPYNSEFQCPSADEGKCVSIPDAYETSISGENPLLRPASSEKTLPSAGSSEADSAKYNYLNKKYEKITALIGNPVTPVVVPPDVVRVLLLSYTGEDNDLFGYRYIYFFASKPKWLLSSGSEVQE